VCNGEPKGGENSPPCGTNPVTSSQVKKRSH
jgi:hypothetical protein